MKKNIKSPLIENNDVVFTSCGIWSKNTESEFSYTDGDAAEDALKAILARAKDRSLMSLELETASYDWISNYHLSSDRTNIYRFLDLAGIESGLELGSGCGAITRYLGEQGILLDAVEGNKRRAQLTRLRCEELENIQVIHSNFNELKLPEKFYDAVFLTGVLEYAKKFLDKSKSNKEALLEILRKSFATLKPNGIACIAIENRMGLKYWLGAKEDHYGQPFIGLYNYPNDKGVRTYDRDEWHDILSLLGGEYCYRFIYPFPDYKMARAILSEDFVKKNPFAHSHLFRMPSTDNGKPVQASMNEFLLWESFHLSGKFEQFANSFLIIISRDNDKLDKICTHDFMHFSGRGRKPEYRTLTSKKRDEIIVKKTHTSTSPGTNDFLEHDLSPAPYTDGELLVSYWLHALAAGDSSAFEQCIKDYYQYLLEYWQENKSTKNGFDLLPFNIIVGAEGNWEAIDKEWVVNIPLTPEFILFRALFWFPGNNESLLSFILAENNISTLKDFIEHYFQLLSLPLNGFLEEYVANEELLQTQIADQLRANPIQNMLLQPLRQNVSSTLATSFLTQLYWSDEETDWSEDRSLFEPAELGVDCQEVVFKLPPSATSISRLRFDPADRAGFFKLHSLTIRPAVDDYTNNEQWNVSGINNIAQATDGLENIEYCKNGLGELFISTGNDPHLIIVLPSHVRKWLNETGILFSAEMDWPKSTEYLVVMDSIGKKVVEQEGELKRLLNIEDNSQKQALRITQQASKLKETSDQVKAKDIYIDNIEKEIEAMRQTRVWRYAEYLRTKIYYRLLDGKTMAQKSLKTLRQEGGAQFIRKVKQKLSRQPDSATLGLNRADYNLWVEHTKLTDYDIGEIKSNISELDITPLFSIVVPVYDVDQEWLVRTIDSVRSQLYENWELCLCDDLSPSPHVCKVLQQYADLDSRIKILFKDKNEGIALTSNAALSMATGDYVGLLDHDDELTIDALYENARAINTNPGVGILYSDEDKLDMQGRRCDPFFKPDYSPELLRSQNYICHFTVIRKSILDELGGFRQGYDGSQDHDLILRALEKTTKVHHIRKILYHWRKIPGSTAAIYDSKSYAWEAGRKAVEDSLQRAGVEGTVSFAKYQGSYRAKYSIVGNPLVTIIIPFKDKGELLKTAVDSILEKTKYQNYEILGISNNSSKKETRMLMDSLTKKDKRVKFSEYNVPFNFSDINNHAVHLANGEYVVLLNNDIEVISPEWLEALLEFAQLPEIGAVGGKLYYPDDRIQHAGIVIGMSGVAGHPHSFFHKHDVGYYARAHVIHNVSAVTGACLMVEKKLYESVGGMDSENFGVAYNDIDFCLKLRQKGYRNVFTPYCELYHFESQSRGYEDTPEKVERLEKESSAFRKRWDNYFKDGDPCHSPHLSLANTNYSIRLK